MTKYILLAKHPTKTARIFEDESGAEVEIITTAELFEAINQADLDRVKITATSAGWYDFETVKFEDDGQPPNFLAGVP